MMALKNFTATVTVYSKKKYFPQEINLCNANELEFLEQKHSYEA